MSSQWNLDLAWLAEATPMMTEAYWTERGTRCASAVDLREGTLEGAGRAADLGHQLAEGQGAEPVRQLGRWFERVHLAALRSTPGVDVLAANTPLRAGSRTIGELDVLYRQDGRVVHREIAVKFYLAAKPGRDPAAWVGPGKRDRLDLKLDRLATHQSTVASQAREAGAWPDDLPFPDVTEVLLLGSLFSPADDPRLPDGANPNADQGHWYYASDFAERFADAPWCELDKPWWLSPEHVREHPAVPATQLVRDLRRPRFVASATAEIERAFVVPDGWWADL